MFYNALIIVSFIVGLWFTLINIARLVLKNSMPNANLLIWAVSVGGYCLLRFWHVIAG